MYVTVSDIKINPRLLFITKHTEGTKDTNRKIFLRCVCQLILRVLLTESQVEQIRQNYTLQNTVYHHHLCKLWENNLWRKLTTRRLQRNSLHQNTRQICNETTPNNVKQRATMYTIHMQNFDCKYCVPSWMFVDNFSRQTNNKHPHNPHSLKRADDEAGSRDQ